MIEIIVDNEPRYLMPIENMGFRKVQFRGVFGEGTTKMIPRSEWKPSGLSGVALPIKDQNGIGACNAFATITAMEYAYAMAYNQSPELSAGWLYGRINGGRDQGSILEDAIAWATEHGVCLKSTVGMLDWRSNPSQASSEAKLYRVLEWWECPTFDHVASAIQMGFAVNIGMSWADGDNVDSDGWLPDRARGRTGGHAICRTDLVERGGKWGVRGPNSWGTKWGVDGYMTISETRLKADSGQFGWFAVRAMTYLPGLNPVPSPMV